MAPGAGPAPWPIVGCAPEMLRQRPTFRWIHRLMKEMDTDIACIRLGNVHVIPVTCPEIAREFLEKHDAIFSSRPTSMATRIYSGGFLTTILTPYGDQWKKMRKVIVSEIISPARHHWLQGRRTEEADNLVKYIYNRSKSLNVRTVTRQYPGNVIRKLMFGKRCFGEERADGGPTIAAEEHIEAIFTILRYLYAFCISDYFPCLVGLDLDGHEKFVEEATRTVNNYQDPIIDSSIGKWRRFGNSNQEFTSDEPHDLLDVLVTLKDAEGKPLLTPEEIKAQVTEIMFATIDNPSNAVEWAMAEMTNQPEILQTTMDELDRVVGKERPVQERDIPCLNYIKIVLKRLHPESGIFHPIAPFIPPHMAMSDAIVAGYFIPKGSHVLLSHMGLGRNPKVQNKPFEFRPERHLTSDCTKVQLTKPDLRFISFSIGRRGCVAPLLGTMMTVMLLARMVQGFYWKASHDVTSINLDESPEDMFLADPLVTKAEPRLPLDLYP